MTDEARFKKKKKKKIGGPNLGQNQAQNYFSFPIFSSLVH